MFPSTPHLSTSLSGPILNLHSLSGALLIHDTPTVRFTLTSLLYRLPGLQIADIPIVATTGLFKNETDILKVFSMRTYLTCVYTGLFLWVSISEYLMLFEEFTKECYLVFSQIYIYMLLDHLCSV
jgi:hypothetical protein